MLACQYLQPRQITDIIKKWVDQVEKERVINGLEKRRVGRRRLLEMPLFFLVPPSFYKFEQSSKKDSRASREAHI